MLPPPETAAPFRFHTFSIVGARTNPRLAVDGLALLAQGVAAEEALERVLAAGNLLVGEATPAAMREAFAASRGQILAERLMRALEAGEAAGGDRRGRVSAAILVASERVFPYVNLRVDEHPDPVAELRRIYDLVKGRLEQWKAQGRR